jgi:signal transduction histidine kinase
MQAYKRAARLQDSLGRSVGLSVCYGAIGDIYAKLSDTTKALENYERAEPYSERFDVKFNRIELLQKMGVIYQRKGSYDKAQSYFARATVLNKEMNRQIYDIIRAGQLYRQQDSIRASLNELSLALRWAENVTVQTPLYQVLYELALTHKQQADRSNKSAARALYIVSLDSALLLSKKSLQVMLDAGAEVATAERFLNTYTLLHELSKEVGDIQGALQYHEELHRWKDSTVSNEKYRAIAAMDSRAVVEAIEAKVETLEAKERLQRAVSVMVGIATLALAVIVGLLAWRYNERKRATELLQAQNDQLTALNIEKNEFLGIAAHDLKNPLSAILSSAEILERYYENDDSARDFVRLIITT